MCDIYLSKIEILWIIPVSEVSEWHFVRWNWHPSVKHPCQVTIPLELLSSCSGHPHHSSSRVYLGQCRKNLLSTCLYRTCWIYIYIIHIWLGSLTAPVKPLQFLVTTHFTCINSGQVAPSSKAVKSSFSSSSSEGPRREDHCKPSIIIREYTYNLGMWLSSFSGAPSSESVSDRPDAGGLRVRDDSFVSSCAWHLSFNHHGGSFGKSNRRIRKNMIKFIDQQICSRKIFDHHSRKIYHRCRCRSAFCSLWRLIPVSASWRGLNLHPTLIIQKLLDCAIFKSLTSLFFWWWPRTCRLSFPLPRGFCVLSVLLFLFGRRGLRLDLRWSLGLCNRLDVPELQSTLLGSWV